MQELKTFLVAMAINLLSYLQPVQHIMESLLAILFLNFVCGAIAGYVHDNESFSWRKAMMCICIGTTISAFICALYFIGERQGSQEGTLFCISMVMYLCDYVFAVNILRNLCKIFKNQQQAYSFFYYIYILLSAEFVKKFPSLTEYLTEKTPEKPKSKKK